MLVLSRHVNESIHIGDDVSIVILGVEGDKVKIGIQAPRSVTILRGEIFDALQAQEKVKALLVEGPEPDSFKDLRELIESELDEQQVNSAIPAVETPAQKE
jgi:carbon storage regulator